MCVCVRPCVCVHMCMHASLCDMCVLMYGRSQALVGYLPVGHHTSYRRAAIHHPQQLPLHLLYWAVLPFLSEFSPPMCLGVGAEFISVNV